MVDTENFISKNMDYDALCNEIRKLQKRYPFLSCCSIGKSLLGRNIFCLTLGNPQNSILFAGAFHGMEWITSVLLLNFAQDLCYAEENHLSLYTIPIYTALKRHGICIIPCVNPDGVEISLHGALSAGGYAPLVLEVSQGDTLHWQSNARGVDINHNFNADWFTLHRLECASGICGPSPTRYGGTAPESEPETASIAAYCRHKAFRYVIAFHSQGEEIYYNYGEKTPPKAIQMAEKFSYWSGYQLAVPEGLASMGGFKDWFIDYFNRPGFTIEVGFGKNPLPLNDIKSIYPKLREMMVRAIIL